MIDSKHGAGSVIRTDILIHAYKYSPFSIQISLKCDQATFIAYNVNHKFNMEVNVSKCRRTGACKVLKM